VDRPSVLYPPKTGPRQAMRRLVFILSLVLLGLAGGGSATVLRSGLYGEVTRGPIVPVCVAEQPCTAPASGAAVVFSRPGRPRAARIVVHADGSYRVRLAPGLYAVRSGRSIEPAAVRVLPNRMRHVDFSIDTGIR
jgi:hypothetical protein